MGILFYGLVIVGAAVAGVLAGHRRNVRLRQQRRQGAYLLLAMRRLLEHLQQHRGLTTGYLRGDRSLAAGIEQTRHAISDDLRQLDAPSLASFDRWLAFDDHWSRLGRTALSLSVAANLDQHNRMLANLLQLIEDIAANRGLLFVVSPGDGTGTLWRELLQTTEWLGQARALGTGIAAAGASTGVERIRLGFLCERIRVQSGVALATLARSHQGAGATLDHARETVNGLIAIIEDEFLGGKPLTVLPSAYFDQATNAIGAQFRVVDEFLATLCQEASK